MTETMERRSRNRAALAADIARAAAAADRWEADTIARLMARYRNDDMTATRDAFRPREVPAAVLLARASCMLSLGRGM